MTPNPLVADTGTPPIPEARAWLDAYDGRQGPIINLSQAAPGLPPPPAMLERLARAAADPATATYGPILGEASLRETYAADVAAIYGADTPAAEIAITTGCNQAFVVAVMAVARAGDRVLLPEPWYFNHEMTLRMLGIEVIALPCRAEHGFVPDIDEARRLVTATRPKAIVLVTPNNPTGAAYPAATLTALARLARDGDAWLILDETYRDFLDTPRARPHDLLAHDDARSRLVQLYSFSKSYAMPGHRIGAMRVPPSLMAEVAKIQDCLQICAPRVGQIALTWAIPALADWREANRADIVARAAAFRAAMTRAPIWRIRSIGAYFAYVEHPYTGVPARTVARHLATEAGVLVLPGPYFGSPAQEPFLRFAFANADNAGIAAAVDRIAALSPPSSPSARPRPAASR